MSTLLSLDLTSALRVAVEQSMPRLRNDPLLTSGQVSSKAMAANSFAGPTTQQETQNHKDKVSVRGTDLATLVTGGLLSTESEAAIANLSYTSEANVVTGQEFNPRSTFVIIA
jgi:hypothetical protein